MPQESRQFRRQPVAKRQPVRSEKLPLRMLGELRRGAEVMAMMTFLAGSGFSIIIIIIIIMVMVMRMMMMMMSAVPRFAMRDSNSLSTMLKRHMRARTKPSEQRQSPDELVSTFHAQHSFSKEVCQVKSFFSHDLPFTEARSLPGARMPRRQAPWASPANSIAANERMRPQR